MDDYDPETRAWINDYNLRLVDEYHDSMARDYEEKMSTPEGRQELEWLAFMGNEAGGWNDGSNFDFWLIGSDGAGLY